MEIKILLITVTILVSLIAFIFKSTISKLENSIEKLNNSLAEIIEKINNLENRIIVIETKDSLKK